MEKIDILKNLITYNPVNGKLRFGQLHDGGYVVVDGYEYDYFLGAGLNMEVSFEEEFSKKYPNVRGTGFDGQTGAKMPTGMEYMKKNIASESNFYTTNLKEYAKRYNNIFIKMDIEAAEWDWIPSFEDCFPRVKQIVFEAHGFFEPHYWSNENFDEKILEGLQILNKIHYLVHVHANNWAPKTFKIGEHIYPNVLELTFIRKEDSEIDGLNTTDLPLPEIDYPNNMNDKEFDINFWPFNSK